MVSVVGYGDGFRSAIISRLMDLACEVASLLPMAGAAHWY